MQEVWTVLKVLQWSSDFLKSKGIDSARLDTEVLLAHVLNLTRIQLYINFEQPLSAEERASFRALLSRRAQQEPIAHLIQEKEFYGRPFKVTRDVLIPRPDSELIVEETLKILEHTAFQDHTTIRILDIGTGSGCLAISLDRELHERQRNSQNSQIVGIDISESAITVAEENRLSLGAVSTRFLTSDILNIAETRAKLSDAGGDRFHVIVSNPPYISCADHANLMPSVKDYETPLALVGGEDGLLYYRQFAEGLQDLLYEGGKVVVELGFDQSGVVSELFAGHGWRHITIHEDLAQIPRVLCAERC